MFFFVLRLLLLITSNFGLWELLRRKTKVNIFFIPSLTVALQTSVLLLTGILNLLFETTMMITGFGLAYLIFCIWKEKNVRFFKNYVNIGYLFLAVVTVFTAIALRGSLFQHYDDFSHWGMVVRRMLSYDRFPNFQDILVFKEYPIGSNIYIYYFSRLLSAAESVQMTAQAYVMTACLLPLFCFCKKNSVAALFFVSAFTYFFFTYNIALSSLLVDTLLPVVSACALLYMYQYCDGSSNGLAFYLAGAYLIQIVQIKNSGVFFVLIAAAWAVYRAIRVRNCKHYAVLMLMPLISFFLWHSHCRYVFDDARYSKHAMHPKYYGHIVSQKNAEDFVTIPKNVFLYVIGCRDFWIMVGLFLIIGLLVYYFVKESLPLYLRLSLFCGTVSLAYQIGLVLMYLFSMPNYEASILAEIGRYEKSVVIFLVVCLLPVCMKLLECAPSKSAVAYALTAAFIMIPFVCAFLSTGKISFGLIDSEAAQTESAKERNWLEKQIKQYDIPSESSYCVLLPKGDSGLTHYMCIYLFNSDDITVTTIKDADDMNQIDSRYILVYDYQNEMIQEWIKQHFPDQVGNSVIVNQSTT